MENSQINNNEEQNELTPVSEPAFHIRICRGGVCRSMISDRLFKICAEKLNIVLPEGELPRSILSEDGRVQVEFMGCIRACDRGPIVIVNEYIFTYTMPKKMEEILDYIQTKEQPE